MSCHCPRSLSHTTVLPHYNTVVLVHGLWPCFELKALISFPILGHQNVVLGTKYSENWSIINLLKFHYPHVLMYSVQWSYTVAASRAYYADFTTCGRSWIAQQQNNSHHGKNVCVAFLFNRVVSCYGKMTWRTLHYDKRALCLPVSLYQQPVMMLIFFLKVISVITIKDHQRPPGHN